MGWNKLSTAAAERGMEIEELLAEALALHKSPTLIAFDLGVFPNSIYHWLRQNGWRHENGQWIRPEADKLPA